MRESMNRRLMQNIKNGVWGLKKLLFTKTQFEFLKETGHIPADAELPNEEED